MSDKKPVRLQAVRLCTPVRLGVAAVAACFIAGPVLSNPVNPTVVNGTATFNQTGKVLTVTNSNGAIINWQQFNIGAGETTHFAQASASSSVLNRVLANDPSVIYGTLSSNGRVWLVNPAGILVGAGGRVDVAGFVASTLNISNADFLAGRNLFINDGTAQNVINQGEIKTPSGGSVYLIGSNVTNEGLITTPNGETLLAAGQTVSLIDSATPGVKVDITGAAGNATNLGQITADAGRIGIAGVIVRNSGLVNASSVIHEGGRIFLKATKSVVLDGTSIIRADAGDTGSGGNVLVWSDETAAVDGVISARGGRLSGGGGFVETSGKAHLTVNGLRVDTGGGQWLLDPSNFTIGVDITGAALGGNLASNDVTILSNDGGSGSDGDIFVNDAVAWASAHTLTLSAYRNIEINSPVVGGSGSTIVLRADNTGTGTGTAIKGASGMVNSAPDRYLHIYYNPASYASPTDFNGLTGGGPYFAWMLVNDVNNLQAMSTNLGGKYAVGRNIDASATAAWNSGAGFVPVGNSSTNFIGVLDGLNHSITGLTINRPATDNVGLFGYANGATIQNLGLSSATIAGNAYVGSLAGQMNGGVSNISNSSSSSAAISGAGFVGGLVGWIRGNISHSYTTGSATGTGAAGGLSGANQFGQSSISYSYSSMNVSGNATGGLVGGNDGIISNSYSTGAVTGNYAGGLVGQNHAGTILDSYSTGAVNGTTMAGGLVGYAGPNDGYVTTIINSYSTGPVSGGGSVGGLVGVNLNGTVTGSFWDTDTSGQSTSAGGTGKTTVEMKTAATFTAAGWSAVNWDLADGSYPVLKNMPALPICVGYDNCWTGAIDSLWATAGNWTAGHAPFGAETVKIDVAGTPTISLIGANVSFGALWLAENLDVDAGVTFTLGNLFTLNAGTATFNGTASVHSYTQTGGTLAGSGNFTVTDNYLQSGGAINGAIHMAISQASGTLNFSATQVGWVTLNAGAVVLGPIGSAGGLSVIADSLQVTAPVSTGLMTLYPQTYSAIRLGSTAASTLSLLQSDLDNLTVGEAQFFASTLTVNNGANTVTLAHFDTVQLGSQVAIDSPLTLSQTNSTLFLNAGRIDINETITAGAGGVFLGKNASSVAYLVGVGIKTNPGNTVELTDTELNRIVTTGPVTIGDPYNAHNVIHGPMQIVGPIDLSGVTTQLRLVGNGITQAAGATITVPQLAADGYGSINLPEANHVGTFAAKTDNGSIVFVNEGPLTIGKVATIASPYNFATSGVVAGGGHTASVSANGAMTLSAGAGETVKVSGTDVWLTFNGDLNLNAGAGGQTYVEAELASTIHLDFSNSAGQVKFNGAVATDTTNGLAGPGTPNFIGFWDNGSAAVQGSTLLLTNTSFSFGGGSCISAGFTDCWTGSVDSLWANGANWQDGSAPAAPTDRVRINSDAVHSPHIAAGAFTLDRLFLDGNIAVDGGASFNITDLFTLATGTATFNGGLATNRYTQTGGVLAGSGAVAVSSEFLQTGGAINRSGNIAITHTGNLLLGDITTTGVLSAVATGRILGGVHTLRGDSISLTSLNGGSAGDLAIDADVAAGSALTATINAGAAQGGIYLRNFGAGAPASITLIDAASNQRLASFYQDSDLVLGAGHNFNAGTGRIVIGAGGSMSGIETIRFGGAPTQITLLADQDMSLSNPLVLPSAHIGLAAGGVLDIGFALTGTHLTLNAATMNVSAPVTASGDLAAGAGIMNIDGIVSAQNVNLAAGTLNIGGSGGIWAGNHLVAVVAGDANITGGYLKTSSGDLEMLAGGNLSLNDGGHIWGGYMQMSSPYADVSIAVGGDIRLNDGAHISAANDVYLNLLGPASTLYLNDAPGYANSSYILSDIGTGVIGTAHLTFLTRNSGGIVIDGEETTTTIMGGSGFFAVDTSTPALPDAGLEITYAQQAGDSIAAQLVNALNRAVENASTTETPTDSDQPDVEKVRKVKKELEDEEGFGSEDGKDGKKDEKPAQKKVAQCL
jgi:filamentous hemagglutinin family protein